MGLYTGTLYTCMHMLILKALIASRAILPFLFVLRTKKIQVEMSIKFKGIQSG